MTQPPNANIPRVLRHQTNWKELFFYQKSEVIYQLTFTFSRRFLPAYGDRTVDQMVQAARSGKQNIVEGLADGVASSEMQLKLLNVARASIQELQEDFVDYLTSRTLRIWDDTHPRYNQMLAFCREHNLLADYQPFLERWQEEEMANIGYTLCRMVDRMMTSYIQGIETQFIKEGGIKERMHAARAGYRKSQDERLRQQEAELAALRKDNAALQQELAALRNETAALQQENATLRKDNATLREEIHRLNASR
ncbi:MAG: four helix bundle suffix domain-containing protein [Paludibacteraceae bacterium]|nr:four helix bundle suffix domain-containing protein [Paludibacteraceae bacterium]